MCMGGGGGGRATITEPNYAMYDSMFQQQKAVIDAQINGPIQLMQAQLNDAVKQQQSTLQENLKLQETIAANTQGQAQRLASLMGPPPPEKSAAAPVTGKTKKAPGKSGLRIDQSTASSQAAGTGLNIT
jgi:hypothetical protein